MRELSSGKEGETINYLHDNESGHEHKSSIKRQQTLSGVVFNKDTSMLKVDFAVATPDASIKSRHNSSDQRARVTVM